MTKAEIKYKDRIRYADEVMKYKGDEKQYIIARHIVHGNRQIIRIHKQ